MMKNIFLSFCGADREVKDELKNFFQNSNNDYNILESDEFCHSDFAGECIEKIAHSQIFVAIVSDSTMAGSFCKNEIIYALKREKLGHLNFLLFKLCDSEFTPDFEFLLNNRSDLNQLTRGTKEGYERLNKKINHLLMCREEGHPEYEDVYTSLPYDYIPGVSNTVYRKNEIEEISKGFEKSNVVFLHGVSGMGRMFTARGYYSLQKELNKNIVGYNIGGRCELKEFIVSLDFSAFAETCIETDLTKKYVKNIRFLQRLSPNVILVANDVSVNEIDGKLIEDIKSIGAKLLITTSSDLPNDEFPVVNIDPFDNDILSELFFSYYACDSQDKEKVAEYLPKLMLEIGYHTGALVFLAKTFNYRCYDADGVIESILNINFECENGEKLAQEAISHFFGLDDLSETEKDILFYLSWNSFYTTIQEVRMYFKCVGVKDLSAINLLKEKGYVEVISKKYLNVPDAVAVVAREQIVPSQKAKFVTIKLLFDELGFSCDRYFVNKLEDFTRRYAVINGDIAVKTIKSLFCYLEFIGNEESGKLFLNTYAKLKTVGADDSGLVQKTINYVKEYGFLIYSNEMLKQTADSLGVSADFSTTYMSDDELTGIFDQNTVEFDVLERLGNNLFLQNMTSITAKDIGKVNLQELGSQTTEMLAVLRGKLNKEDIDENDILFIIYALVSVLPSMINMNYLDGVVDLCNTIIAELESCSDGLGNDSFFNSYKSTILMYVFYAYCNIGLKNEAYRVGEELLKISGQVFFVESCKRAVIRELLEYDVENENYASAKARIEILNEVPGLSSEEFLCIADCYSNIQMFDGDWYKMRDYMASIIDRYGNSDSKYMESIVSKYADCIDIITSIENSIFDSTNERDIVDASDLVAYKKFLKRQIGSSTLKSCEKIIEDTMSADLSELSDDELRDKAYFLSEKIKHSKKIDDGMISFAFSLVREAGYRVLGIKLHMVQILAGALMVKGYSTQVQNGEGKTYTIVLPAVFFALCGRTVDIISSSRYLSERDSNWMGEIYRLLGISVGYIENEQQDFNQYCVSYMGVDTVVFKYMCDNSKFTESSDNTKSFDCAIVDEADVVMIEQATKPYSLYNDTHSSKENYEKAVCAVYNMITSGEICTDDYDIEKNEIIIHPSAVVKMSKILGFNVDDKSELQRYREMVKCAIRVEYVYKKDEDYCLKNGKPYFENLTNGQAFLANGDYMNFLICKEKLSLPIELPRKYYYYSYIGMVMKKYKTLIGTSGTMMSAENMFADFYNVKCIDVPTNKKVCRVDRGYRIFANDAIKNEAIMRRVSECIEQGRPVLVVAPDTKRMSVIEDVLKHAEIPYNSINYKNDEDAADVFAVAGLPGNVTISSNISGRGVDIVLGGSPKFFTIDKMKKLGYSADDIEVAQSYYPTEDSYILMLRGVFKSIFTDEKKRTCLLKNEVINSGGLMVIGTSLMQYLRHEQQVCGRSGRQGEPGESEFFISYDDKSICDVCSNSLITYLKTLMADSGLASSLLTKSLRRYQIMHESSLLKNSDIDYNVILSEMCEKIYNYAKMLILNDELLVKKIIAATRNGNDMDLLWKKRVLKCIENNKKRNLIFKKQGISIDELISCIDPNTKRDGFQHQVFDEVNVWFTDTLEWCKELYIIQREYGNNIGMEYRKLMQKYILSVNERFEEKMRTLVYDVCCSLQH